MSNPTIVNTLDTSRGYSTNELRVDMHRKRLTSFPELTSLTTILLRLAMNKAHNFRVDLTQESEIPTAVTIAATEASPGASISVQSGGVTLVLDTILWNPEVDEYRRVTANPTSNTIAVTNLSGTAAAWSAGDVVFVLLPGLTENDANYRKSSAVNTNIYNYVQLNKLQFSIPRLSNAMKTEFGSRGAMRLFLQQQKWREFRIKDEQQKWFGARTSGGTAPANRYTMGGIKSFLQDGTLYKDFGGVFTETGFDNYLGDYFDQNPDAKRVIYFGAPNVLRMIYRFAKDKLDTQSSKAAMYGMKVKTYIGGGLEVDLVPAPVFSKSPVTKGWGFILDMESIMLKVIDKATLHKEALNVGESEEIIDTYRSVDSILVGNEERHSMHIGALV